MKKFLITFVLSLGMIACQQQEEEINREIISYEDEPILVGEIDIIGLGKEPYKTWFDENYQTYVVDDRALEDIDLDNVEITLFLGTWCEDSRLQVPQFYKILRSLDFDPENLTMISLDNHPDRDLQSPGHEEEGLNIEFVPTFIFYRNGQEAGRIIEYPEQILEIDMANILGKKE